MWANGIVRTWVDKEQCDWKRDSERFFAMKPVLAVRHVAHEGLGTIGDALRRKEVPVEIVDAFEAPPSESGDLRSEGMRGRETRGRQDHF